MRLQPPTTKSLEGNFFFGIFSLRKNAKKKITEGEAIKLSFILTQSVRDKDLMNSLIEYLGPPPRGAKQGVGI